MAVHAHAMTVAELREAERQAMRTVPESVLMDRAADAVANRTTLAMVERRGGIAGAKVVVLAGSGNNGGDALLAGARLARAGADVTALLVEGEAHDRGCAVLAEAGGRIEESIEEPDDGVSVVHHADVVIDGIVGLGARAGLRTPARELVSAIPRTAFVVAVDIPSGLEADSNRADDAHVKADLTVTFTAPKKCLLEPPAADATRRFVVADVGVGL